MADFDTYPDWRDTFYKVARLGEGIKTLHANGTELLAIWQEYTSTSNANLVALIEDAFTPTEIGKIDQAMDEVQTMVDSLVAHVSNLLAA